MITEKTINIALDTALCAYAITVASYTYELCFMNTVFGGWVPMIFISVSPLIGFIVGRSVGRDS